MNCLTKYAVLGQLAGHNAGHIDSRQTLGYAFFSGELLAMHALVHPLPTPIKLKTAAIDVLVDQREGYASLDPRDTFLRKQFDELVEFQDNTWLTVYQMQSDAMREKIMDATIRAYEDIPNVGLHEDRFTAGYLFAGNLIISNILPD
jgi:hypothetical protein